MHHTQVSKKKNYVILPTRTVICTPIAMVAERPDLQYTIFHVESGLSTVFCKMMYVLSHSGPPLVSAPLHVILREVKWLTCVHSGAVSAAVRDRSFLDDRGSRVRTMSVETMCCWTFPSGDGGTNESAKHRT